MVYINYYPRVLKQLSKLPKNEQKRILEKIENLSKDKRSGKNLQGELRGYYSVRAWPYRIIYEITKGRIFIVSVAHRREVYKKK